MKKILSSIIVFMLLFSSVCLTSVYAADKLDKEIFAYELYKEKNPDVLNHFGDNYNKIIDHWLKAGIKEGRQGSYVFDAKFYLNKYDDLKRAFGTDYKKAYEHYKKYGIKEGRIAHPNGLFTGNTTGNTTEAPKSTTIIVRSELIKLSSNFMYWNYHVSNTYRTVVTAKAPGTVRKNVLISSIVDPRTGDLLNIYDYIDVYTEKRPNTQIITIITHQALFGGDRIHQVTEYVYVPI